MNEPINWSPGITLEEIERLVILKAYRFYNNNKTTTANALGIAIRTLDARLGKYEADAKEQELKDAEDRRKREDFLARSRGAPQSPDVFSSADARARMESVTQAAAKPGMSVQERQEVQSVLPKQTPQGGPGKARRTI